MITAAEARNLYGEIPKSILGIVTDDIKHAARRGAKSVDVDFLEGSNIDRVSSQLMQTLDSLGYECEYHVDKYFWIDFGFRHITISWKD